MNNMRLAKTIVTILLITFFIAPLFVVSESQRIYSLDLEYDKGSLKVLDVNLITGFPDQPVTDKSDFPDLSNVHKLELLSKDEEILYQTYFDIPNKIYGIDDGLPPSIIELDQVAFTLLLPYYRNGQTIIITKDEKEILIIDIAGFQMYCGDKKCQYDEDNQSCPQDCVEREKSPPPPPPEEPAGRGISYYLLRGVIFIILIIVVIFLIKRLTKKKKYFGKIEGGF